MSDTCEVHGRRYTGHCYACLLDRIAELEADLAKAKGSGTVGASAFAR